MIHVINRHCNFSSISANKIRPSWFSRKECFDIIYHDIFYHNDCFQEEKIRLHVLFDGNPIGSDHFLANIDNDYDIEIKVIDAGTGSKSYRIAIQYVLDHPDIKDDDIVYLLEDDYLHRGDWYNIIEKGLELVPNGYVSLFDHNDKYILEDYKELKSQILFNRVHWRTTPSTTDTLAIYKSTLRKHKDIFFKFSPDNFSCSLDHQRCLELWNHGVPLLTSIPGYATHCEEGYLSPGINWQKVQDEFF